MLNEILRIKGNNLARAIELSGVLRKPMNYREEVMKNCPGFSTDSIEKKLSLGGLGCAGEAGEVADLVKKILHHDVPLASVRDKLIKEIGDVYWYLEYLCATLGINSDEALISEGYARPEDHEAIYRKLSFGAMGLVGLGGEIATNITLVIHVGGELQHVQDDLVTSMADLKWFLRYLCEIINTTESEAQRVNTEKLSIRHKNGWSPASQQAKADENRDKMLLEKACKFLKEGKAIHYPHTTNSHVDEWISDYEKTLAPKLVARDGDMTRMGL